jgi:superfamily I DNA/RNA helicase
MLYARKREGAPIEILDFRSGELEAREIMTEIERHRGVGVAWVEIAILYWSDALSRLFKEALMWARIPYSPVGDVGVYQRAEIKFALALLRYGRTQRRRNQHITAAYPAAGQLPRVRARLPAELGEQSFSARLCDYAEERRLAYVAISRGMNRVTNSHCALRVGPARPSDFIKNIPDQHVSSIGFWQPQRFPRQTSGATPYRDRVAARSA